jgi:hypothetical protein
MIGASAKEFACTVCCAVSHMIGSDKLSSHAEHCPVIPVEMAKEHCYEIQSGNKIGDYDHAGIGLGHLRM